MQSICPGSDCKLLPSSGRVQLIVFFAPIREIFKRNIYKGHKNACCRVETKGRVDWAASCEIHNRESEKFKFCVVCAKRMHGGREDRSLTLRGSQTSLIRMRFIRASIALLLGLAICAGFAADCVALTSKESMQCSRSMRCPSHRHQSGECCKNMPSLHATLGQPSAWQTLSLSHVSLGIVVTRDASAWTESSYTAVSLNSHGPPTSSSPPPLNLRV